MVTESSNKESEIKRIKWKYASENIDDDLHTDILFLSTSIGALKEVAGISYSHSLLIYEGHRGSFYYPDIEAQEINKVLINKIISSPSWGESINKEIIIKSVELENVWKPYHNIRNFSAFPTDIIKDIYNQQLIKHCELYQYAWIPEILQDTEYGIEQYIVNLVMKYDSSFSRKKVLSLVSGEPIHTVYFKHDLEVLNITETILARRELLDLFSRPVKYIRTSLPYEISARIRHLINRYGYLGYHGYDERKCYDFNYYLKLIKNYLNHQDDLYSLKQRIRTSPQRSTLWDKMTCEEKRLLSIYQNWGVTKARRRLSQLKNFFFLDMLIEEIAYRYQVPEDYIRFMAPEEINVLLASGSLPVGVEKRAKSCCCYLTDKNIYIGDGENVSDFIQKEKLGNNTHVILQGNIACGGYRIGKAFLIDRKSDISSIDLDDCQILVAKEADPDIFCIFDKISAIVTDQGGVTCHIASLAREYGIPCIVGTQYATSVISKGDMVEVDAFDGFVKIVKP